MYVLVASSAFDARPPHWVQRGVQQAFDALARPRAHFLRRASPALGAAAQGVAFAAALWLLLAGPGFASAADSLLHATAQQAEGQASR